MSRYELTEEMVGRVDGALAQVRDELLNAMRHFGPMVSPHEAASILREEHDEWWEEVKRHNVNKPKAEVVGAMRLEIVQVAAMAVRALVDVVEPLRASLEPPAGDVFEIGKPAHRDVAEGELITVRQPDYSVGSRPQHLEAQPIRPRGEVLHYCGRIVPRKSGVLPAHVPPPELHIADPVMGVGRILSWDVNMQHVIRQGSCSEVNAWTGGWLAYWEGREWAKEGTPPSSLLDHRRDGWRDAQAIAVIWAEGVEGGRGMREARTASAVGIDSVNAYLAGIEKGKELGPYAG